MRPCSCRVDVGSSARRELPLSWARRMVEELGYSFSRLMLDPCCTRLSPLPPSVVTGFVGMSQLLSGEN